MPRSLAGRAGTAIAASGSCSATRNDIVGAVERARPRRARRTGRRRLARRNPSAGSLNDPEPLHASAPSAVLAPMRALLPPPQHEPKHPPPGCWRARSQASPRAVLAVSASAAAAAARAGPRRATASGHDLLHSVRARPFVPPAPVVSQSSGFAEIDPSVEEKKTRESTSESRYPLSVRLPVHGGGTGQGLCAHASRSRSQRAATCPTHMHCRCSTGPGFAPARGHMLSTHARCAARDLFGFPLVFVFAHPILKATPIPECTKTDTSFSVQRKLISRNTMG